MNTKKFIEQVISGDLGKNEVLEFASHVKRDYNGDIQALADDLFLLAHGALLYHIVLQIDLSFFLLDLLNYPSGDQIHLVPSVYQVHPHLAEIFYADDTDPEKSDR